MAGTGAGRTELKFRPYISSRWTSNVTASTVNGYWALPPPGADTPSSWPWRRYGLVVEGGVDLAVVVAGAGDVQGFVAHRLFDGGPIAAVDADVDDGRVVVAQVADRGHAQLAACAPAGRG